MTEDKEKKLDNFILQFKIMAEAKFRKGDQEHHSDLSELSILDLNTELLGECVDTMFYLLQQRENIKSLKKYANNGPLMETSGDAGRDSSNLSKT